MSATIVADVRLGMEICDEQTFGPVTIARVNVAGQNETQAPYGGPKHSVYDRFDGSAAIDEFTELEWITLGTSAPQ